jgi:glutamyl-tRNA synthetase
VGGEPVRVQDLVLRPFTERVDETVGDFVLRRRDGLWAYQLAVVVDDLAMEVDEVVRGRDLASSTARQIQLIEALGGKPPSYAHVPLMLNAQREKLSKRDQALELRALREAGVSGEAVVGYLAWTLGLAEHPRPRKPQTLVELFSWQRLWREDWRLPEDIVERLHRSSASP